MAWASLNTYTAADKVRFDMFNSLANDDRNWGGPVNGGGFPLSNVILDGSAKASAQTPWLQEVNAGGFRLINTGDVGIGTTTPGARLHVHRGTDDVDALLISGADANKFMVFQSSATAGRMQHWNGVGFGNLILNPVGGDVLIGPAAASGRLCVSGVSGAISSAHNTFINTRFSDGGAAAHMGIVFDTGGAAFRGFQIGKSTANFHICRFDPAGAAAPTYDFNVAEAGNVGIGTAGPQVKLHVLGPDEPYTTGYGSMIVSGGAIAHQLRLGFDASNGRAWIQAVEEGVAVRPLVLNGAGGNVAIGGSASVIQVWLGGSLKTLSVDGSGFVKAT